MFSFISFLFAFLLVAGDVFQVRADNCNPFGNCHQSLSKDPAGASPYCSSILTSPVVTVNPTPGAPGTGTVFQTHTVTVTGKTRFVDGATHLETSTSLASVTETIQSTATSKATDTTLIVQTRPVTQTSRAIETVVNTVYVYSASTTVIVTSTTFVTTETVGEYAGTETAYLETQTQVAVTLIPRGDAQPAPVPTPTYLSTCAESEVYQACEKLYPPSTSTVTRGATVSDVYITVTRAVTYHEGAEATVFGPRITKTVVIPGTSTIYSTVVQTVYVTQVVSATSVASPTEVVVESSTVSVEETATSYTSTATEHSTQVITSVYTDDLDGQTKTITLSTRTVTQVRTSHTAEPTVFNGGFDEQPASTEPWQEYNNGKRAPISLSTMSHFGPHSLQFAFERLADRYQYSAYIFQPLVKHSVVPDKQYMLSARLRVPAASAPIVGDGCSKAHVQCVWGYYRNPSTPKLEINAGLLVNNWYHAQVPCAFTAAQINAPSDIGIMIGFTCGASNAYIDSITFEAV